MKKSITDYNLNGKKVIIRVDFNVPLKDGIIMDDNRIISSLPTIKYAIENNAKVILLSHLGRIKDNNDLLKNSLEPIAKRLSELLDKDVLFVNQTRGQLVLDAINNMDDGDVILLQNTRFEDLEDNKESLNDKELGEYWAGLGDIFINDAFGTSHRTHASNVGIASKIPNGIGFLIKKELDNINPLLNNPTHPFVVILGGSKVSDKIGVIENLIMKADYILIGGGMSFTFLKAMGYNIGSSLLDVNNIEFCQRILKDYNNKIILPIDFVVTKNIKGNDNEIKSISLFDNNDIGADIGPKTIDLFKKYIKDAKEVVWNGPMGIFEIESFSKGTKELLEYMGNNQKVIIGGGDTASAAINMGYKDKFTHISTGGGATLEMLEGKSLPGIEVINEK